MNYKSLFINILLDREKHDDNSACRISIAASYHSKSLVVAMTVIMIISSLPSILVHKAKLNYQSNQ